MFSHIHIHSQTHWHTRKYNVYCNSIIIIIIQGVGLASLAHSLFMNFEIVVSTGWRAGIDCKRAGWRSGQGRGDMCGPCTY